MDKCDKINQGQVTVIIFAWIAEIFTSSNLGFAKSGPMAYAPRQPCGPWPSPDFPKFFVQ